MPARRIITGSDLLGRLLSDRATDSRPSCRLSQTRDVNLRPAIRAKTGGAGDTPVRTERGQPAALVRRPLASTASRRGTTCFFLDMQPGT